MNKLKDSCRGRSPETSHALLWRILRDWLLHPYHIQPVQSLAASDCPTTAEFSQWILVKRVPKPPFIFHTLLTDESTFAKDGVAASKSKCNKWKTVLHNNHV